MLHLAGKASIRRRPVNSALGIRILAMSLDIVIWLSCSVSLPSALPQGSEWEHWRVSADKPSSMPKELAAMLDGAESWNLGRPTYILRASYARKDPFGWEQLAKAAPGIEFRVIKAERSGVTEAQLRAEAQALEVARQRIQDAKMGVSLVLEGVNEPGITMQEAVAAHLAKECGGAYLETPSGFYELDREGKRKA